MYTHRNTILKQTQIQKGIKAYLSPGITQGQFATDQGLDFLWPEDKVRFSGVCTDHSLSANSMMLCSQLRKQSLVFIVCVFWMCSNQYWCHMTVFSSFLGAVVMLQNTIKNFSLNSVCFIYKNVNYMLEFVKRRLTKHATKHTN